MLLNIRALPYAALLKASYHKVCANPEIFARGDLTFFNNGKRIQIALKAGYHRPASETCDFSGGGGSDPLSPSGSAHVRLP